MEFRFHRQFGWVVREDPTNVSGKRVRLKVLENGIPVTATSIAWDTDFRSAIDALASLDEVTRTRELRMLKNFGFAAPLARRQPPPVANPRHADGVSSRLPPRQLSRKLPSQKRPENPTSSQRVQKESASPPRVVRVPAGTFSSPAAAHPLTIAFAGVLFDLDNTLASTSHLEGFRIRGDRGSLLNSLQALRAYPGVIELLQSLSSAGVRLGLVTDAPRWYAEALLAHLTPRIKWGAVVCYDDVPLPKPSPHGINKARAALGTLDTRSVVYVGDERKDVEAAYLAGVSIVAARWENGRAWAALPPVDAECLAPDDLLRFLKKPQEFSYLLESAADGNLLPRGAIGRHVPDDEFDIGYSYLGRYFPPNTLAARNRGRHNLSRDVAAKHEPTHVRFPDYWVTALRAVLAGAFVDFDVVTVVPAKANRPRRLEMLLEAVKPAIGAPRVAYLDVFRFVDDAESLKGLGLAARAAEANRSLLIERSADVRGKRVLVIDDVVTTGATFRAANGLLNKSGCKSAEFLTFTRTVNPKQPMERPCECGRVMVPRRNRSDGTMFWGCTQFGRGHCRHTIPFSLADQRDWNELQA